MGDLQGRREREGEREGERKREGGGILNQSPIHSILSLLTHLIRDNITNIPYRTRQNETTSHFVPRVLQHSHNPRSQKPPKIEGEGERERGIEEKREERE